MVREFTTDHLKELYLKAKVIVADCLNGPECYVLEAALEGTLILTNNCAYEMDLSDFPIPYKHKYSEKIVI